MIADQQGDADAKQHRKQVSTSFHLASAGRRE
jgi:hypothetical protein